MGCAPFAGRPRRARSHTGSTEDAPPAGARLMDPQDNRDIRLINTAGAFGVVFWRLALGELLLLYVTRYLKIPKEEWALVASIIPVVGVFYLVSAYVTEHLRRRKWLSLSCFAVARLCVPAMILLPLITTEQDQKFRLAYMAAVLIGHGCLSALGSSAWLSWVADIVPSGQRGRFYAARLTIMTLVNVAMLMAAGRLIDLFGQDMLIGYAIIFGFAFVVGELDVLIHSRVADRPMREDKDKARLFPMLAAPWRHSGFRNLMLARMMGSFAVGLFGPFLFMYRVEELGMSVWLICGVTAIHLLVNVLTYKHWQKVGERVGYRTVYNVCQVMMATGIVYYLFLPQGRPEIFLAVICLAQFWHGTAWAGAALAVSTMNMETAPDEHRSMYFAQVTAVLALTMGLGTFCGRLVYIYTNPISDVYLFGTKLTGMHVIVGLFALIRLLAVRLFHDKIPDAKGDAAMPRIARILRTNSTRLFSALLPLERPLPPHEKEKHVNSMRELMNGSARGALNESLDHVLDTTIGSEDELHGIIGKEQLKEGRCMRRMLKEIAESAPLHLSPVTVKASVRRIQRLCDEHDIAGCLRAVRRFARRAAERIDTPKAAAAFNIIEAIVEVHLNRPEPQSDAVLLAVYACLQMVREPEKQG